MKISNLTETATPSSMPDNNTAAPKFGRSDDVLESGVGTSTSGGVASIAKPMGKMRTRGQGSMFQGISTSSKYANSRKAGIKEDVITEGSVKQLMMDLREMPESEFKATYGKSKLEVRTELKQPKQSNVNEDELSEEQLQAKKRREDIFKKAKDRELGNKPESRDIVAKEATGRGTWDSNSSDYEGDYGGSRNWGRREREDDERHDLDPSDWYFVKDGKMFKVSVYPNQEQQAISLGYSRNRKEAQAKADQQGVAEGLMNKIANKVMGAAPEQPKYKVGQRVKYETSPHQPDWKDVGRGVGVITAYKNGHYMINGNPVNHFEIKGVVEQGVEEAGYPEVDHMPGKRGIGLDSAKTTDTHVKTFHASKEKEAHEFAKKNGYIVKKHVYPKSANNSQPHEFQVHKNEQGVAEAEKNPHTSALGKALHRDLSKEKKASPAQVEKNKARWAQRQADKEQGVAEGFNGEYDDEAGMAESNLLTLDRAVKGLMDTIDSNDNLPEWCQEKIAKAEMMLVSVWDYLQSQKQMGNDPKQDMSEESKGLWANIHAKQNRIKNGSGERMRKPGSKGAPTASALRKSAK